MCGVIGDEDDLVGRAIERLAEHVTAVPSEELGRMARRASSVPHEARRLWRARRGATLLAIMLGILVVGLPTAFGLVKLLAPTPQVPPLTPGQTTSPGQAQPNYLLPPSWTAPPSGWVYVLDPNNLQLQSQILLVSPSGGGVEGAIRVGYDPAMALSPDGGRLYAVSADRQGNDSLSIIDTQTGKVIQTVDVRNRLMETLLPAYSTIAVSPDGQWLYVRQMRNVSPGQDEFSIATFDTSAGAFLPQTASVTDCGTGQLVPLPGTRQVAVLCGNTNDVRFLTIGDQGTAASEATVSLPITPNQPTDENGNPREMWRFSGAALSPDATALYVVTQEGRLYVIDVATNQIARILDLGLPADRWITPGPLALSSDGTTLYVPTGPLSQFDQRLSDQVLGVNVQTGKTVSSISTGQPFWSLAPNTRGGQLEAVSPETRSLIVMSAATGQARSVQGIGATPALAVVAP